jgi:ABC-type transport system involved in cytochrome c biogenesis ATPase subunit
MMLQNVRLINYRGLKDATIPLAPITLLTGMNGAGKTSVLEGLYCLLSQPVPDVAVFPRYQASMSTQAVNVMWPTGSPNLQPPFSPVVKYDYPAFWKECSTDGASECQVAAGTKEFRLAWKMRISDFSELDHTIKDIATNYGLQGGANVPYALWEWEYVGRAQDPRSHKPIKD